MTWFSSRILFRINRNILECKEVTKTKTEAVAAGINRNILECKGVTPKTVIRSG